MHIMWVYSWYSMSVCELGSCVIWKYCHHSLLCCIILGCMKSSLVANCKLSIFWSHNVWVMTTHDYIFVVKDWNLFKPHKHQNVQYIASYNHNLAFASVAVDIASYSYCNRIKSNLLYMYSNHANAGAYVVCTEWKVLVYAWVAIWWAVGMQLLIYWLPQVSDKYT